MSRNTSSVLFCCKRVAIHQSCSAIRGPAVPFAPLRAISYARVSTDRRNVQSLDGRRWNAVTKLCSGSRQCFSTSNVLMKKGSKTAARDDKRTTTTTASTADDPSDFSVLDTDIAALTEKLKSDLSKLRAGGRFNIEVLESLRVQPDKNEKQTVKLNDVAQVILKGRVVNVLVGEKDLVKPVTSAIQNSSLSLTPQPDPTGANPLLISINIPPPTAESRKAVVAEASKAGDKASTALRDARGKQQKKHRALQVSKSARPDDLHKASTQMEKLIEKAGTEIKRIVDNAKKVLESG